MDRYLIEQRIGKRIPPHTIYLIRHGQSTHNARSHAPADANDAIYLDAPLTAKGEAQARNISSRIKSLNVELVVTSPLTRATQTCLFACAEADLPQPVVTPLCTERLAYACDIGSPVSVLEKRFPNLNYSLVFPRDGWWWTHPEDECSVEASLQRLRRHPAGAYKDCESHKELMDRVNKFKIWLLEREETCIAVFGHGVFLKAFAGHAEYFGNTEIRKIVL